MSRYDFNMDSKKLDRIGFALFAFDVFLDIEAHVTDRDEQLSLERQFVLACLSESGFDDRDDGSYEEIAKENIQTCLNECLTFRKDEGK